MVEYLKSKSFKRLLILSAVLKVIGTILGGVVLGTSIGCRESMILSGTSEDPSVESVEYCVKEALLGFVLSHGTDE